MSETSMKGISIERALDEDTRKQAVWLDADGKTYLFSLHITDNEIIITDYEDYTKIYSVTALDFYHLEKRRAL